ncbi:hypothetical protein EGW08_002937, partial [Elysia chlorotica]
QGPAELSRRLGHVLACAEELLHRTLASLESLAKTLMEEKEEGADEEQQAGLQSSASYKLLQGLVSSVASVVDSSTLLFESVDVTIQGGCSDTKRLEKCSELIHRSCKRLLSALSGTYSIPAHDTTRQSSTLPEKLNRISNLEKLSDKDKSHSQRSSSQVFCDTERLSVITTVSSVATTMSSISLASSVSSITDLSSVFSSSGSSTILSSFSSGSYSIASTTDSVLSPKKLSSSMLSPSKTLSGDVITTGGSMDKRDTTAIIIDQVEITLLSQSHLQQLDSAAQEVSMATALFVEYVHKISGLANQDRMGMVTPRGRRLLPKSPEKTVVTPAMGAAHIKKLSVKKTIALAIKEPKGM